MDRIRSRFVKFSSTALALIVTFLTTLLLVPSGASAKDHKGKGSDNQAQVVAHIPFAGLSDVDMAMQKKRMTSTTYMYSTQETMVSRLST